MKDPVSPVGGKHPACPSLRTCPIVLIGIKFSFCRMTRESRAKHRRVGSQTESKGDEDSHSKSMAALSLGAIGVVFGDIGTSPLYAFHQCFKDLHTNAA